MLEYPSLYLYSDGFMEKGLSMRSFHNLNGSLFHDFQNAVFRILPVMNYRMQDQLLGDFVIEETNQEGKDMSLKSRKAMIQSIILGMEGEMNGNISLYQKLKGTPLLFTSSTFHLVHESSLKFLSLCDESLEDLVFDLVDFPNERCVLRFNPCLSFQKLMTNVVYNGDIMVLASTKSVVNRYPNMFCTYYGNHHDQIGSHIKEQQEEFLKEVASARVWASVDDFTRLRINIYRASDEDDKNEYIYVGDVIALQLSELNLCIDTVRPYDPFEKVIELLSQDDRQRKALAREPLESSQNKVSPNMFTLHLPGQFIRQQSDRSNHEPRKSQDEFDLFKDIKRFDTKSNEHLEEQFEKQRSMSRSSMPQIYEERTPQAKAADDVSHLRRIIIDDLEIVFADLGVRRNTVQVAGQKRAYQLPPSSLWKIESENFQIGGLVQFEKCYRLRHFQTGRYLEFRQVGNTYNALLSTKVFKSSVFTLLQQGQEVKNLVRKDSFFYLKHVQTGLLLGVPVEGDTPHEFVAPMLLHEMSEQTIFKMRKANQDDIWEIRFLLYSLPLIMETVTFIGKMKQRKPVPTSLFKAEDIRERIGFYRLFLKVDHMLELLESFVNNRMTCNISATKEYSKICSHRQDIVREQNIMALLCWTLFRSFPDREDFEKLHNPSIQQIIAELGEEKEFIYQCETYLHQNVLTMNPKKLEKLQEHHMKRQILLAYKLYKCLKEISKQRVENQNLLAKFLAMFQNHIGQAEFVSEFQTMFFCKNKEVLVSLGKAQKASAQFPQPVPSWGTANLYASQQIGIPMMGYMQDQPSPMHSSNCIDKIYLKEIIAKLKLFEPHTKFEMLQLLASSCTFNSEAIYSNQEIIYKNLLEEKKLHKTALIELDQQLNIIVEPDYDGSQKQPIEFLKYMAIAVSGSEKATTQQKYLKAQLQLFAKLCLNRNFNSCKTFQQVFSIETLVKFIFNTMLDDEVKATLLELLRALYIDREPHTVQVKPNLVRVVNLSSKKDEGAQLTHWNFIIYGQVFEKMFLYEDEDNHIGINRHDENELGKFIQGLKVELLNYLMRKCDFLSANMPPENVYNAMTLEVLNVLYMVLQFGLFQSRNQPAQTTKFMGLNKLFSTSKGAVKENEIERLVTYLAMILEYDSSYFSALQLVGLKRKYHEQQTRKQDINRFMETGMAQLGDGFQSLFGDVKSKKQKVTRSVSKASLPEYEKIDDSLYKKVKGLMKVLDRYSNKTYTLREDNDQDLEVQVKIQICRVFSYLLDLRQDYLIDNCIAYFQEQFQQQSPSKKTNIDLDLLSLLPEDVLRPGQDYEEVKPMKEWVYYPPTVRSFDQILERPFLEVLLLTLYFTQNSELENRLVELLELYATQKNEFVQHLKKLQLLMQPEQQQLYYIQFSMTSKLKNYAQYSQIWLQIDTPAELNGRNEEQLDKALSILWKLESILQKSSNENAQALRSRQSMFYNIGGYFVVNDLVDKALSVIDSNIDVFLMGEQDDNEGMYKQDLCAKIVNMVQVCVRILALFARNNKEFQEAIFKNVVRQLMNYTSLNLGQVELVSDLFRDNYQLIGLLTISDVNYFVDLIVNQGKFPEFLEFFDIILTTSEQQSSNPELHKLVLTTLLNTNPFDYVNPFKDMPLRTQFYLTTQPDIYKRKFLHILARCMRLDVGVSLATKCSLLVPIRDLLGYLFEKSQDMRDPHLNEQIQREMLCVKTDICIILGAMVRSTRDCLNEIASYSKVFLSIVLIEKNWMEKQQRFIDESKDYLLDTFLPLFNAYYEMLKGDDMSTLFRNNQDQQGQEKEQMQKFADTLICSLERMFFRSPQQLQHNQTLLKSLQHLSSLSGVRIPRHIISKHHKPEIETDQPILQTPHSEAADHSLEIPLGEVSSRPLLTFPNDDEVLTPDHTTSTEVWSLLLLKMNESQLVTDTLKSEPSILSQSIWRISEMFQSNVKGPQKDLLLLNEDMIVKILRYLQFWQEHLSSKENVIFILKVLKNILKDSEDDDELYTRQTLFDKLNATQIIIVLLWDEYQNDPDYLLTLLKFAIILIENGNQQVQKTLYNFFLTSPSCEKFFFKIKTIINLQIATSKSNIKLGSKESKLVASSLRLLQLMCEGHNTEMQNYLRYQSNAKISHDLVSLTVQLLSSIQISAGNYGIVMQCFDTLSETIQGPCRANQIIVGNSKFLEYAVLVLSEDEKVFPKKDGNISMPPLHRGLVARLKHRCLISIIALLECNDPQDTLILRIIRAIPLSVLTSNLTDIYSLFKQHCKQEYDIQVFKRYDQKIEPSKEEGSYEFIIENGFYIYTLMQLFLSNKKGKDMLYEDSDMRDVLNEFTDKESDLDKMLKNNFFMQLTRLGGALAKQGLGAMKSLKKNIDDIMKDPAEKAKEEELKLKLELKELTKNSIKFFREHTCSLEVVRDKHLFTIYFPKLPFCKLLPKDLKDEFHETVPRTSSKTKLTYLMDETDKLVNIMKHEEKLRQLFEYNPILGIFANHGKLWEQCAFISTIILNLIIVFSYSEYFAPKNASKEVLRHERLYNPHLLYDADGKNTKEIITTCGTINLAFNSLIVFFFLIKRAPLKIQHIWEPYYECVYEPFRQSKFTCLNFSRVILGFCLKSLHSLWVLLQDFDILYYTTYIMANIVGLFVHPFFFAFHLLDFLRIEELKTVVQAIWYPRGELALALLLLIILEYYFALFGYIVFYEDLEKYDEAGYPIPGAPEICKSYWHCFFTIFDYTFKKTGSVGSTMQDPVSIRLEIKRRFGVTEGYEYQGVDLSLPDSYATRFIFDNLNNIVILFILLNMLQGIIINMFSQLRKKLQDKLDDQTYFCFICGINREKLDKSSGDQRGFFYHIKKEHYMWNYVFYRAYLNFKEKTDFNGNESYVHERIAKADISWFPIKRAKAVSEDEQEEQGATEMLVDDLQKRIRQTSTKVEKLYYKITEITESM